MKAAYDLTIKKETFILPTWRSAQNKGLNHHILYSHSGRTWKIRPTLPVLLPKTSGLHQDGALPRILRKWDYTVEPEQRANETFWWRNKESKEGSVIFWFYSPAAPSRWFCAFYTALCLNSLKRTDLLYNLMVSIFKPPPYQLRGAMAASGGGFFREGHLKTSEKCYRQWTHQKEPGACQPIEMDRSSSLNSLPGLGTQNHHMTTLQKMERFTVVMIVCNHGDNWNTVRRVVLHNLGEMHHSIP